MTGRLDDGGFPIPSQFEGPRYGSDPGRTLDLTALAAIGALVYFILVGDLGWWRDLPSAARILTAAIASVIVIGYVAGMHRANDATDRRLLLAGIVFLIGAIASAFPRQSFDSMLAVLLYLAALWLGRGVLARAHARRLFVLALMITSGVMAVVCAAQMVPPLVEWWIITGRTTFPPLDMKVWPIPWVFRYEIALLLVMLYPSWWIGPIGRLRGVLAIGVGILTVAVCVVAGSRTIWLAVCAGLAVVVIPVAPAYLRATQRRFGPAFVGLGLLATLLVAGMGGAISERLLRSAPLVERLSIWESAIEIWSRRPFTGLGPGSFPWALQVTDYFETNALAPRHADNAAVQLLAEGGLFGLVAMLIAVVAVGVALWRGRSRAAQFALVTFLVAHIGTNPSEYAFVMAAAVGWVAYGAPRVPPTKSLPAWHWTARSVSLVLGLVLIGAAYWATMLGSVSYTAAQGAIDRAEHREAEQSLRLASALDPGLALYPRQLGTLLLIDGDVASAVVELEKASTLNASDDTAWRILSLAKSEAGDLPGAMRAIERAIAVQRSDPSSLLVMAGLRRAGGDEVGSQTTLIEVVQGWPLIVAAPGWSELAGEGINDQLLAAAYDRWAQSAPGPIPARMQPLLIGIMLGRSPAAVEGSYSVLTGALRDAFVDVTACEESAGDSLENVDDAGRRRAEFWALSIRYHAALGDDGYPSRRAFRLMTSEALLVRGGAERVMNPLNENGARGSSPDTFGYRRSPIDWPDGQWLVPSPETGYAYWYLRPVAAARAAGLPAVAEACGTLHERAP